MSTDRVFRKTSLDRLASPEQLDQVMRVTSPRGWIALAAIGLLLVAGVAWGVFGSLADKVAGRGILVRSGGVLEVVAPATGQVADVAAAPGDSVSQGEVVARISQPELFDRLQQARARLDAARQEYEETVEFVREDARLQRRTLEQQQSNLEGSIQADQASLARIEDRLQAQERLVDRGLITQTTLLSSQQEYQRMQESIRSARAQLAKLKVQWLATDNREDEAIRSGRTELEQLQRDVQYLTHQHQSASQVVSPYSGRILEVMTEQGQLVGQGEPILSLDRTGPEVQELVAVIYVPSIHGKVVRRGMEIHVSPSTVRPEEYGMMVGEVTYVSSFPATPKGMLRVLKNDQLVRELSGGDAPYEVHAEFTVDPSTVSRYRWTSSEGPPTQIQSGTTIMANVNVARQRPISKVIPLLRRWTGT